MRYGAVGRCRKAFCLDKLTPESYYKQQAGGYIPPYIGVRYQRGRGLGSSLIAGLSRVAVPLLKKGVTTIGKQALSTGAQLAGDIISGKNVKKAVKRRAQQSGQKLLKTFLSGQTGRGGQSLQTLFGIPVQTKRRRTTKKQQRKKKKKTTTTRKRKRKIPGRRADIFDY